jgi:hypothetical protein
MVSDVHSKDTHLRHVLHGVSPDRSAATADVTGRKAQSLRFVVLSTNVIEIAIPRHVDRDDHAYLYALEL